MVLLRDQAAPVFVHPTTLVPAAVDPTAARPPRPTGPDPSSSTTTPGSTSTASPDGGSGPSTGPSGGPAGDSANDLSGSGANAPAGPVHAAATADPHHGDLSGEGGAPGASLRLDGGRTDVLAAEAPATPGGVVLGVTSRTPAGEAVPVGPAAVAAEGFSTAVGPGAAGGDETVVLLRTAVRTAGAPDLGDRPSGDDAFWDLAGAGELRRALADAAGLVPGSSAVATMPAQEPPGRSWRAAGLGGFFAQAFSLGALNGRDAGSGPDAGAVALQPVHDSQLVLADLTQRLTDAFTRLVQSFYLHFLGRAAAAGEVTGWVGLLLSGQTEEQVLSAFLSTAEFYRHVATLVPAGTGDERFVQGLYTLLLGRPAGDAELGGWLNALPTLGRDGVASALLHSTEYRSRQVEFYFQGLLQRPATPAEVAAWAGSPFDLRTIRLLLETNLPAPAEGAAPSA
jgi:hypothetical protein